MKKYSCYYEEPSKNIYLKVDSYSPNSDVKLSITSYQGKDNVIEVCLTEGQVDSLISDLMEYKNKF